MAPRGGALTRAATPAGTRPGRPAARLPLPAGARASWGAIAIRGEPWPGEPPTYDPSAKAVGEGDDADPGDTPEARGG